MSAKQKTPDPETYRSAARRIFGMKDLIVPRHGNVQMVEGGAFVEATIWVADVDLKPADGR